MFDKKLFHEVVMSPRDAQSIKHCQSYRASSSVFKLNSISHMDIEIGGEKNADGG